MIINLDEYFTHDNKWLHDELKKIKQDEFPADFKLKVNYTTDQYYNLDSPGIAISKLQELLSLLDFPNFFVQIITTNEKIKTDLEKIKELYCPYESALNYEISLGTFEKKLFNGNTLCILPWMHLYVNPQGLVGTCCEFNEKYPLGLISEQRLDQIANSVSMKTVRKQMLSGHRPDICSSCWTKEDNDIQSMRQSFNSSFSHHFNLVEQTNIDGSLDNFQLRYLDFRASNVCNLKCRMCSGKFSSRIAKEESDLYKNSTFIDLKLTSEEISSVLSYIEKNVETLEAIYFAGGEPLIMEEHYQILDLLIKYHKTNIKISYNTNLTQLSYKKYLVTNYWQKFSNVYVGASIDLIGPQAEYVRSGTDYAVLEKNYEIIKSFVKFNITSIVHLYNIFNLPKLQRHWILEKNISPMDLSFRVLIHPENMSLRVLPTKYKKLSRKIIEDHMSWLTSIADTKTLVNTWENVLQYMDAKDDSYLLKDFFRLNDDKDKIRQERFEDMFPEYRDLRSYV